MRGGGRPGLLAAAFGPVLKFGKFNLRLFISDQAPVADTVHHAEPGNAEKQGDRCNPEHEQQRAGAQQFHDGLETVSDDLADDPAGGLIEFDRRKMQRRQRTTRDQRREKTAEAQREVHPRQRLLRLLLAVKHPAQVEHHDREQVSGTSEEVEQQVGNQRPDAAHAVLDVGPHGRLAETGIRRIVGEQREPENECQRAENVQGSFAKCPVYLCGQTGCGLGGFSGFCHI
jgi:hypothetical protein